ncbi:MAG: XTP/dITP diphosphatase [Desulfomonilia bacterium]
MKLLIATTNPGKIREISEILASRTISLITPADVGVSVDVAEDGATFAENATTKAVAWNRATGVPCLADDSGLSVDALGGSPGVFSARYAGENATDAENMDLLLRNLAGVENRSARFFCVVAVAFSPEHILTASGQCEGVILAHPLGDKGFGYDPVFYDPSAGKTFAQMTPDEKNARSHRRKALIAVREMLRSSGHI